MSALLQHLIFLMLCWQGTCNLRTLRILKKMPHNSTPIFRHFTWENLASSALLATASSEPSEVVWEDAHQSKNNFLFNAFTSASNLTAVATEYVNFCDENFNIFLQEKISNARNQQEERRLGKIRYEINCARRQKLIDADRLLREILSAGEVPKIEAKLKYHLDRSDIDMAFLVILQMNIEDAANAKSHSAVEVMSHVGQLINEYQDNLVKPPVRMIRLLVRTESKELRKQMLRQKLLVKPRVALIKEAPSSGSGRSASASQRPQQHGVSSGAGASIPSGVAADPGWGGAEVTPEELEDTISDVLAQMSGVGHDGVVGNGITAQRAGAGTRAAAGSTAAGEDGNGEDFLALDMEGRCAVLRQEIVEVLAELEA